MSGQKTIQKCLKTGKLCPEHFPMYQRCQEFSTINTSIYISNLLQYGYFSVNKEGTYTCQMGNNGRLPQFNGVVFLCFFLTIQSGSRIRHLLRFWGPNQESANRKFTGFGTLAILLSGISDIVVLFIQPSSLVMLHDKIEQEDFLCTFKAKLTYQK